MRKSATLGRYPAVVLACDATRMGGGEGKSLRTETVIGPCRCTLNRSRHAAGCWTASRLSDSVGTCPAEGVPISPGCAFRPSRTVGALLPSLLREPGATQRKRVLIDQTEWKDRRD